MYAMKLNRNNVMVQLIQNIRVSKARITSVNSSHPSSGLLYTIVSCTVLLILLKITLVWTETKSMFANKNNIDGRKNTDAAKPNKMSDSKKFVPVFRFAIKDDESIC